MALLGCCITLTAWTHEPPVAPDALLFRRHGYNCQCKSPTCAMEQNVFGVQIACTTVQHLFGQQFFFFFFEKDIHAIGHEGSVIISRSNPVWCSSWSAAYLLYSSSAGSSIKLALAPAPAPSLIPSIPLRRKILTLRELIQGEILHVWVTPTNSHSQRGMALIRMT